jgi:hypothetical protein
VHGGVGWAAKQLGEQFIQGLRGGPTLKDVSDRMHLPDARAGSPRAQPATTMRAGIAHSASHSPRRIRCNRGNVEGFCWLPYLRACDGILCYPWRTTLPPVMAGPHSSAATESSAAEQQLIKQLSQFCRHLHWGATALQVFTALAAIVLSLIVATYTGTKEFDGIGRVLKLLAFLTAICTALFSGFRLRSKAADLRMCFRMLNADLMRYRIGELTASQLITTYSKAEERIGQVEVDGLAERSPAEPPTT